MSMTTPLGYNRHSCETCPFAGTDKSEEIQDYGCLPTAGDILKLKRETGHNWACHSNKKRLCGGLREHVEDFESTLDLTKGGLISYETWYQEGEEIALKEAAAQCLEPC